MNTDLAMAKETLKNNARRILNDKGGSLAEREELAATYLVEVLFADIRDKAGAPYLGHLYRVAGGVGPALKAAALMHDLLEDIPGWTAEDLAEIGFSARTIKAVQAVTKKPGGEKYFDAMMRLSHNSDGIEIKRSDLRDNSNLLRLTRLPNIKDFNRVAKYFLADKYLQDVQEKNCAPGTNVLEWMQTKPNEQQSAYIVRQNITL